MLLLFGSAEGTPGLGLGPHFGGTSGFLPSPPQLCWLSFARQSVHIFQFISGFI